MVGRVVCRHGLRDIVRAVGVTTVIVTHDQEEAWDIADQVVVFNKGAIEQRGTPQVGEQAGRAALTPPLRRMRGRSWG